MPGFLTQSGMCSVSTKIVPAPTDFPSIGDWLAAALAATGEATSAASVAAGLSPAAFRAILLKDSTPRFTTLEKIAAYYCVALADLLAVAARKAAMNDQTPTDEIAGFVARFRACVRADGRSGAMIAAAMTNAGLPVDDSTLMRAMHGERLSERVTRQVATFFDQDQDEWASLAGYSEATPLRRRELSRAQVAALAARREKRAPHSPLGRFLWDRWHEWVADRQVPTQVAFAAYCGVSQSVLIDLWSDRRPTRRTLAKLLARFGDAVPAVQTEEERRSAEARASWKWATCSRKGCGQRFQHRPNGRKPEYCTRRCAYLDRPPKPGCPPHPPLRRPKEGLNGFIYDRWNESGESVQAFAKSVGLGKGALWGLLHGKRPILATYEVLQAAYGDRLPRTRTETDRRREVGSRVIRQALPVGSPERAAAMKKAGKTRRDKTMPQGAITRTLETKRTKIVIARDANGALREMSVLDAHGEHLRSLGQDRTVRVVRSLNVFLRFHKDATREHAIEHIHSYGKSIGLRAEVAEAACKRTLLKHGLGPPEISTTAKRTGGRRPLAQTDPRRHTLILEGFLRHGLGPWDRAPYGLYRNVERRAQREIDPREPGYKGLQQYWKTHLPTCRLCAEYRRDNSQET